MIKTVLGELMPAPLTGMEIIMVSPSYARHHAPVPHCNLIEGLREGWCQGELSCFGAWCRLDDLTDERDGTSHHRGSMILPSSCSVASKHCVREYKLKMIEKLKIPIVVTAYPELEVESSNITYVSGLSRMLMSFKKGDEKARLKRVMDAVLETAERLKSELEDDPPVLPPIYLKRVIEGEVGDLETCIAPFPVTLKSDGVRVKLPYERFAKDIMDIELVEGKTIGDVADVTPSIDNEILVKIHRESAPGSIVWG
ncbi:Methyl-coenzyme M reductase operon protein C [Candidatus Methanoperedenaceae archaeon GB50]|nr:Methyl-coenzyme M reductase operon protein C [Candidatus Methanoperedenaceae archaeon GB50]